MADVQRLLSLSVRGFRNLAPFTFEPGPAFNVIYGDNGQGKTNLLEAIDYVARLASFRGARAEELVQHGMSQAEVIARLESQPLSREHRIVVPKTGARAVSVDGKRPRSRASYQIEQQQVLFHAGDLTLTTGGPERRRAFLDRMLEQVDSSYASALAAYDKALRSRNRLLKAERPDKNAITAYDELLASAGTVIAVARMRLVSELAPRAVQRFSEISGQGLPLLMQYQPRVEPTVEALRRALGESFTKDLARGFTAEGPHADELVVDLAKTRAKRFASQGQHRAIVLALKIAELEELTARVGRVPMLLLDDVSSELDRRRNQLLFQTISQLGGQVFLTTTHPEYILLDEHRRDFAVERGQVRAIVETT